MVRYCTVLYGTVLHCTLLYGAMYGAVYGTVWYGTALYCTVLYSTLLYCETVLLFDHVCIPIRNQTVHVGCIHVRKQTVDYIFAVCLYCTLL